MTKTRLFAAALVVLAVLAPLGAVAAAETYAVDGQSYFATQDAAQTWNETGVVSSHPGSLNMTVTVAKSADDVGLREVLHSSSAYTYVRVQYNESIARDVRLHVSKDIIVPRAVDDQSAMESDEATLTMTPSSGREYTAVTFHLSGETDAVFAISRTRGLWSQGRSLTDRILNSTVGVTLPSFATNVGWQTLPKSELSGNDTTAAIETNGKSLTIQYDTNPASNASTYLPVERCSETDASLCKFKRTGESGTVYLLSKSADPPAVRYKQGSDPMAFGSAVWDDLTRIDDRIMADVQQWFGGGGS